MPRVSLREEGRILGLKIAELDHVVLRCRDQARALDFYTRILGLKEERRVDRIGLIQLRAGTSMLDLVPASDPRSESGLNVDHFCLGIEAADLNETLRYLRENNVEVLGEPPVAMGPAGWARRSTCTTPRATSSNSS